MELSHGKFVIMVSDEDKIFLPGLAALLARLNHQENRLAFLRTTLTNGLYRDFGDMVFSPGHEAVTHGILRNNYLTGIVYNRQMYETAAVGVYSGTPGQCCDILVSAYGVRYFSVVAWRSCFYHYDDLYARKRRRRCRRGGIE